jgi:hypothetical protein
MAKNLTVTIGSLVGKEKISELRREIAKNGKRKKRK